MAEGGSIPSTALSKRPCFTVAPLVAAALCLTGCASLNGIQEPVTASDLQATICPTQAEVDVFESLSGIARRNFRDKVVLSCVKAIDRRYDDFKSALQREGIGAKVAADVISQSLSTAGALSSGGVTKTLSGVSSLVAGVGASIDKDVFYQQTLPAVEAAMDTRREKILTSIIDAENKDSTAEQYTLERAGFDLSDYQAAGDLYAAIGELTKTAAANAQSAGQTLAQAKQQQQIAYLAKPLTAANFATVKSMTDKVWALNDGTDRPKLDSIAKALGLTPSSSQNFDDERTTVLNTLVKQAESGDNQDAAVQSLQSKLSSLLP